MQVVATWCIYKTRVTIKKTTVALQVFTKAQLRLKPQLMYLVSADVIADLVGKRGPSWEATKRHQIERLWGKKTAQSRLVPAPPRAVRLVTAFRVDSDAFHCFSFCAAPHAAKRSARVVSLWLLCFYKLHTRLCVTTIQTDPVLWVKNAKNIFKVWQLIGCERGSGKGARVCGVWCLFRRK